MEILQSRINSATRLYPLPEGKGLYASRYVSFSGQTLPQVKDYIDQRYGFKMKSGAEVRRRLEAMKREDLIAQMKRPVLQDYIPLENIEEVVRLLTQGDRQLLIGE